MNARDSGILLFGYGLAFLDFFLNGLWFTVTRGIAGGGGGGGMGFVFVYSVFLVAAYSCSRVYGRFCRAGCFAFCAGVTGLRCFIYWREEAVTVLRVYTLLGLMMTGLSRVIMTM